MSRRRSSHSAPYREREIDGQQLVHRAAVELSLALTSLIGVGVVGKILQKTVDHLPASCRSRVDELIGRVIPRTGPLD